MDSALTDLGIRQAHALAEGLADREIDAIYSSDLGRALHTAEIIAARLKLPIATDERLRERDLGALQGLTYREFQEKDPAEFARFESGGETYAIPEGESPRQQYDRCLACCNEIASRHQGDRVLLVSHGGVLSMMMRHTLGLGLSEARRFSLYNAAINRFSVAGGIWHLDTWGETTHLRGMTTLDDR